MTNDLRETNKLLAKLFFEVRDLRAELTRRAGEQPERARKSEAAPVVSVTSGPGWMHVSDASEVPTSKTPAMIEAERAQRGTRSTREPVPGRSGTIR